METEKFVIRFNFTDGAVFAGMYKGGMGFAPTTATALHFVDREVAQRNLDNGYGPASGQVAEIITLKEAERAAAA